MIMCSKKCVSQHYILLCSVVFTYVVHRLLAMATWGVPDR